MGERATGLTVAPLRPRLMDDLALVFRGSWGASCWCMHPRLREAELRALPGPGTQKERRRAALGRLARRRRAPGLLAHQDGEPVGWIAVAPRAELARVNASRATPPLDDEPVWVVPCITVRKSFRGRGIGLALIDAALVYAHTHGAPAVEAYPRAGDERTSDDNAFIGTEALFVRAGFEVVRGPLADRPRNFSPRVVVRRSLR